MTKRYRYYNKQEVQDIVKQCYSLHEALRRLGRAISGGNQSNLKKFIEVNDIDITHFTGKAHNKGKISNKRKLANQILVLGVPQSRRIAVEQLRRALNEVGIPYKCNNCGINEWLGKPLALEVDHIDECYWNNQLNNLQYLCPNCHTMKNR